MTSKETLIQALRRLATACNVKESFAGGVLIVESRAFKTPGCEPAKAELISAVLKEFGCVYLVLGDTDVGIEAELESLGGKRHHLAGVWIILDGADVKQLYRVALFLGNWHMFATTIPERIEILATAGDLMNPQQISHLVNPSSARALIVSDTDDDRWLMRLDEGRLLETGE